MRYLRSAFLPGFFLALASVATAAPMTFTVAPGNTASNDDAWKSSALGLSPGNYHVEENFESFANGVQVLALSMGGATATITTGGGVGGKIFAGAFGVPAPGNDQWKLAPEQEQLRRHQADDTQFLRRSGAGVRRLDLRQRIHSQVDSFTMTAETTDGMISTSAVLDVNPGSTSYAVEGFLGVTTTGALASVTITNLNGLSRVSAYELDHLQIVATGVTPIPEPASLILLGSGVIGIAWRRRRQTRRS